MPDIRYGYVVTARHVIEDVRKKGDGKIFLRLNTQDGNAEWIETESDDWRFHLTDTTADVAIFATGLSSSFDVKFYPIEASATTEVISQERIGLGDEVFLTGLFISHYGLQRNIPIVRVGNIAAMPEEKIYSELGLIDAYLIEARSIGGISGSPVFVHLGTRRVIDGEEYAYYSRENDHGEYFLLGLMHGHWDIEDMKSDSAVADAAVNHKVNMGIAIVVPVSKILEAIDQPVFHDYEERIKAKALKERAPTPD